MYAIVYIGHCLCERDIAEIDILNMYTKNNFKSSKLNFCSLH